MVIIVGHCAPHHNSSPKSHGPPSANAIRQDTRKRSSISAADVKNFDGRPHPSLGLATITIPSVLKARVGPVFHVSTFPCSSCFLSNNPAVQGCTALLNGGLKGSPTYHVYALPGTSFQIR